MVISFVLRVRAELATDGNFSGEVEAVGSGKRAAFSSMAQLNEILTKSLPEEIAKAEIADPRRSSTTANWTARETAPTGTSVGVQPSLRVQ